MRKWLVMISIPIIVGITLFLWLGYQINQHDETTADGSKQTLIILGAKVKENGVPSLSLKYRLDVAIEYLQKHSKIQVIVSGGQGHDEDQTEASAMYTYLINHGIDPDRILQEDKSTSTYENLLFTKQMLGENLSQITIVSNDFHLARAKYLAKKLNLEVDVIAAPTPKVVENSSRLRERAALLKTYLFGK